MHGAVDSRPVARSAFMGRRLRAGGQAEDDRVTRRRRRARGDVTSGTEGRRTVGLGRLAGSGGIDDARLLIHEARESLRRPAVLAQLVEQWFCNLPCTVSE